MPTPSISARRTPPEQSHIAVSISRDNMIRFKFSSSKTVCMHFCRLRSAHPNPELTLNGTVIPVVNKPNSSESFLTISSHSFHTSVTSEKCVKAVSLLRVVAHTSWGADQHPLLHLYRSLVCSKLDYGSVVYGSARESYLRILDPTQNHAMRLCLGAFRTPSASSMCVQTNEPPLYIRRRMLSIQYSLRLDSSLSNPAYNIRSSAQNSKLPFLQNLIRSQHWVSALHRNLKRLVLSGILYLGYLFQPLHHGC